MITEIGLAAGSIWQFLDERGESRFSELVGCLGESEELLFMALGWLAREGYVVVNQEGADYRITLRSSRCQGPASVGDVR
ncbi:MAG: winged helix-turn-helix domain-containing protein [Candidatus Omnitrophica bacterium]|nr:winged helix-turn-helix domain-containing protein [Candidatus Omnitrophota bacterium]